MTAEVRAEVEDALAAVTGRRDPVARTAPVGGGCVSPTARLETTGGHVFFLKWGADGLPGGMLEAEAAGLRALAAARAVRVPGVVATGGDGDGAWLLLEWLEPGPARRGSWTTLGQQLAALHRRRGDRFGAGRDNYIGPLEQDNRPSDDWPAFWRDRRLAPQLAIARSRGLLDASDARRFDTLFTRLDDLLAPAHDDGASLLHGDLWNGNVHLCADGVAALVDPSAYHGHREVDLAMAELFGGFPPAFRQAYQEAWPPAPGYEPERRAVYQLYYLLVHVNLFGPGYVGSTRATLGKAGA